MLTRRPVLEAADESDRLPALVDRAALVVDEPVPEADPLHGVEIQIGLDPRRALRPRDPEAVGGIERVAQGGEPPVEVRKARGELDDDSRSGLRAELAGERGRRVVLVRHGSTLAGRDEGCSPGGGR
jgi:hypothetical protein